MRRNSKSDRIYYKRYKTRVYQLLRSILPKCNNADYITTKKIEGQYFILKIESKKETYKTDIRDPESIAPAYTEVISNLETGVIEIIVNSAKIAKLYMNNSKEANNFYKIIVNYHMNCMNQLNKIIKNTNIKY